MFRSLMVLALALPFLASGCKSAPENAAKESAKNGEPTPAAAPRGGHSAAQLPPHSDVNVLSIRAGCDSAAVRRH